MHTVRIDDKTYSEFYDGGPEKVTVEFNDRYWCTNCGGEIADYGGTVVDAADNGWRHEEGEGGRECPERSWPDGEPVYATPPALHWAEGAQIELDETADSVTVSISVDDPRGGFALQIYRVPDNEQTRRDNPATAGRILMTVPRAQMSAPHMPLRELMPGVFVLGRDRDNDGDSGGVA